MVTIKSTVFHAGSRSVNYYLRGHLDRRIRHCCERVGALAGLPEKSAPKCGVRKELDVIGC